MDEWINGWSDQRMDGPMDRQTYTLRYKRWAHMKMMIFKTDFAILTKALQTDRRTDRPSY